MGRHDRLKLGIVSGILHPKYGGPVSVVESHIDGLSAYADVELFGVCRNDEMEEVRAKFPQAQIFPAAFPHQWYRGRGMFEPLCELASRVDVIHAHMLWDYPVIVSCLAAAKRHRPFIVTPHGSVLEPWRYQSWHKRIYRGLVLGWVFRHTAAVHALNKAEESACRRFGMSCPIRIIPNGLPADLFGSTVGPGKAYEKWPMLRNRRVMLSVSRFSPEKRLDLLLRAWSGIIKDPENGDWFLVIAGSGDRQLEADLVKLVEHLGISRHVLLPGFVSGDLKTALLRASECFVMSSLSEGFSMAILEAMAAGLPVVYTETCNFPEIQENGAGWQLATEEDLFSAGLNKVVGLDRSTIENAGQKARNLVGQNYTMDIVTERLLGLYEEVMHACSA